MSNLSITEYSEVSLDQTGFPMPLSNNPGLAIQNVSFTATAGQSATFQKGTKVVRIVADADCRILFGLNPTAVASTDILLGSGVVEYFGVEPFMKISAVAI